jgi:TP901 family phage tail tape measure protein
MARKLVVEVVGDTGNLNRAFSQASASAQGFGSKMQNIGGQITSVGKKLTLGVTTPLVAAGVASFKMAEDFQTSMSRVIGLAGQSEKQVDQWSRKLLVLGPQLGKSPRELAEALYFVASSGISTGKALDVVTKAAKASSAGLGDTQQVADALTSVMNAYGESSMSAARATDVLVATVREGKGEAADFAPVIGNVTSFASQLGVSFEEVGAALASMTRLGVDAATASTQLQGVFSNLVRPTKQVQDALADIGLTQKQVVDGLQRNGLLKTLQMLKEHADGNTKALIPLFGNIRALRGVFALVGNQASVVEGVFKRMGDSTGSLAVAFEQSTKRTGFTMEKFKASLEASGIAIGSILAPVVTKIATFLTQLSVAFQNLDPQVQKLIIGGLAFAAVLGPMLIVIGSLVGAIGALAPVFIALASPIGIVVAALVLLTAALVAAVVWPDKLQLALQKMGLSAKTSKEIVDDLRNAFTAIKTVVQTVWPVIQSVVVPALKIISGLLMIVSGILRGDFSEAWKGVKIVVVNEMRLVLATILAMPRLVLGAALAIGKAILQGIAQGLANLGQWVHAKLQELPKALAQVAAAIPGMAAQIGAAITRGILSGMGGLFSAVKDKIIGGVKGAIDGAMGVFGHSPQEVIGVALIDGIIRGWNAASSKLAPAMVDKVNSAIDAAQAAVVAKQGAFASAFDALLQNALSAFDKASEEFLTRTEKKIAAQDERRAKADRQRALDEAKAQLEAAQAAAAKVSGTPNEFGIIAVDPAAIAQAQADLKAAQQSVADAQFAIQRAADEKTAEAERKAYDDKRERQRVHLANQLAALEQNYLNQQISTEQFHTQLIAIFKKFEVPLGKAAYRLGASLADGLNKSFAAVQSAARALASEVLKAFENIKVVVHVSLEGTAPEHRQHGGSVWAGKGYIVGEAGPEYFSPSSSGTIHSASSRATMAAAGGTIVQNIYFQGDVTGEEIVDKVRRGLLRVDLYNPGSAIARS